MEDMCLICGGYTIGILPALLSLVRGTSCTGTNKQHVTNVMAAHVL